MDLFVDLVSFYPTQSLPHFSLCCSESSMCEFVSAEIFCVYFGYYVTNCYVFFFFDTNSIHRHIYICRWTNCYVWNIIYQHILGQSWGLNSFHYFSMNGKSATNMTYKLLCFFLLRGKKREKGWMGVSFCVYLFFTFLLPTSLCNLFDTYIGQHRYIYWLHILKPLFFIYVIVVYSGYVHRIDGSLAYCLVLCSLLFTNSFMLKYSKCNLQMIQRSPVSNIIVIF